MTTFATPNAERLLADLDARTRVAWTTYRDELAGLEDRAYDAAESAAWEQLQSTLEEIETVRAELASAVGD